MLYVVIVVPSSREQYKRLYNFAGNCLYANSQNSAKTHEVCDKMAIDLLDGTIKITLLIFLSIEITCCAPLYKIFFTEEKEMIIPVILPFVDPDTQNGFYINLANQLVTCVYGVIIIPGTEMVTCILKNTISASAAIIENVLLEFEEMLQKSTEFSSKRSWQFQNMILQIMDFDRLVKCHPIFAKRMEFKKIHFNCSGSLLTLPNCTIGNSCFSQYF